jgi:hypothetical protein
MLGRHVTKEPVAEKTTLDRYPLDRYSRSIVAHFRGLIDRGMLKVLPG